MCGFAAVSFSMSVKLVGTMVWSGTYPSVVSSITCAMRRMCWMSCCCAFWRRVVAVSMVWNMFSSWDSVIGMNVWRLRRSVTNAVYFCVSLHM